MVTGAPVAVALGKIDPSAAGPALANINSGWIARGCALMAGARLGCAEPICTSLLPEPISRPSIARCLLIGAAGSSVAPDSVGEAARGWIIPTYFSDACELLATVAGPRCHFAPRPHHARRTSFVDQLFDVARSSGPTRGTGVIIVALALPAALLPALIVAPGLLRSPGAPRLHRLARCAARIANQVVQTGRGLWVFRQPRPAAHAAAAQLAAWAIQCASCYAGILAFDLQRHAAPAAAAAVLLVVNLTAIVPLTPSNVGVFQAACIAVLALGLLAHLHEGLTLPEVRRQAHNHLTGAAEGEVKANSGDHRRAPARAVAAAVSAQNLTGLRHALELTLRVLRRRLDRAPRGFGLPTTPAAKSYRQSFQSQLPKPRSLALRSRWTSS